ncbi:MAG TPA: hypothetical protein VKA60_18130 [Blastocatellia bacterium]|nr:hypothetical protein [Blastocatellia bacterium]
MNLLIILLLAAFAAPVTTPAGQSAQVELRGHVVCLDAAGKPARGAAACDGANVRFALATGDGKLHYFSPDDVATAMFTDARVRRRELQISAQAVKDQLEIVRLQSVREGKLYDIYYFCELCNIRAYAPGLCPCCRNEMEFRETPATDQ